MLDIITLHGAQEMKTSRIVYLSMALDTSMILKEYIHWLSSTLVLMAVAQIFSLSIYVPNMEGKFTLGYVHTFRMIPTSKT